MDLRATLDLLNKSPRIENYTLLGDSNFVRFWARKTNCHNIPKEHGRNSFGLSRSGQDVKELSNRVRACQMPMNAHFVLHSGTNDVLKWFTKYEALRG